MALRRRLGITEAEKVGSGDRQAYKSSDTASLH
jgi:hypothetical protein